MSQCKTRLTRLFKDIEQDYDRMHGTSRTEDLDDIRGKSEGDSDMDQGSEGKGSSSWRQDGVAWKRADEFAVEPRKDSIAQAFEAPAPEVPTELDAPLPVDFWHRSPTKRDKSPEETTPPSWKAVSVDTAQDQLESRLQRYDNFYCRACGSKRTETRVNCDQCGVACVEALSPERDR